MRVSHHGDEHLVCMSSEEVALLVDLCHAAAFSDELAAGADTRRRLQRFMADVQTSLFDTAQGVWNRQRTSSRLLGSGCPGGVSRDRTHCELRRRHPDSNWG